MKRLGFTKDKVEPADSEEMELTIQDDQAIFGVLEFAKDKFIFALSIDILIRNGWQSSD